MKKEEYEIKKKKPSKKNKSKRKGFTLIEIIAVIIIIGIIALIAVPAIIGYLNSASDQTYKSHEAAMVRAAQGYNVDCLKSNGEDCFLPQDTENVIKNSELEYKSYLDELLDPETRDPCDKNSYVFVGNNGDGTYDYEACLKCGKYQSSGEHCQCLDDPSKCPDPNRPKCGKREGPNINDKGVNSQRVWTNNKQTYRVQCEKKEDSPYECGNKDQGYWFSELIESSDKFGRSAIEIYYLTEDNKRITNKCYVETFIDAIPPRCRIVKENEITILTEDEGGSGVVTTGSNKPTYAPDPNAPVRTAKVTLEGKDGVKFDTYKSYVKYDGVVYDNAGNRSDCTSDVASDVEGIVLTYALKPIPPLPKTDPNEEDTFPELGETEYRWEIDPDVPQDDDNEMDYDVDCDSPIISLDGRYTYLKKCKPVRCEGNIVFKGWSYSKNASTKIPVTYDMQLQTYQFHKLYGSWQGKKYKMKFSIHGIISKEYECEVGLPCKIPIDDLKNSYGDFMKTTTGEIFMGWTATYLNRNGALANGGKLITGDYYNSGCDADDILLTATYGTSKTCRSRTKRQSCHQETRQTCSGWNTKYACSSCYHGSWSQGWRICSTKKVTVCKWVYGSWSNWESNSSLTPRADLDVECTDFVAMATYKSIAGDECHDQSFGFIPGSKLGALCSPTREGYTFDGWYRNGVKVQKGSVLVSSTEAESEGNKEVILDAKWTPITYKVYFCYPNSNCNKDHRTTIECTYDNNCTLKNPKNDSKYAKKGYSIVGWQVDETDNVYGYGSTGVYNLVSKKLYPVYEPDGITIKYQDLTNSISDIQITESCNTEVTRVVAGEPVEDLCIPKASNYAFTGWKTDKDKVYTDGTTFNAADFKTENYLLKGNWVRKIQFKYDLGTDPKGTGCSAFDLDKAYSLTIGEVLSSKKMASICPSKNPAPTRSGYTFVGWYTAPQGDPSAQEFQNHYLVKDYEKNGVLTFYSHWTANKYTITYVSRENDGCNEKTDNVYYNSPYETVSEDGLCFPTDLSTEDGKVFLGWYTKSKDGTEITNETINKTAGNHNLYAHYAKGLAVSYEHGTSGSGKCSSKTFAVSSYTNLGQVIDYCTKFSRNGHKIDHWEIKGTNGTVVNRDDLIETYADRYNGKVTIYPVWTKATFELTYSDTIGPVCDTSQPDKICCDGKKKSIVFGDTYGSLCNPYVDGNKSYTDSSGNTYSDYSAIITAIQKETGRSPNPTLAFDLRNSVTDATGTFGGWCFENKASCTPIKVGSTYSPSGAANKPIYAKWVKEVTVTLDPNFPDGSLSTPTTKKVSFDYTFGKNTKGKKALLTVPKKAGYTFVGWYTDPIEGVEVTNDTAVRNIAKLPNLTLYAHWTQLSYSVNLVNKYNNQTYACNGINYNGSDVYYPKKIMGAAYGEICTTMYTNGDYSLDPETGILTLVSNPSVAFVSWSTNGTNSANFVNETSKVSVPKDHTLTAIYGKVVNITLDLAGATALGGNCTSTTMKAVQYGLYSQLCTPSRSDNYAFTGWYLDKNYKTRIYTYSQITKGTDFTIYPKWQACTGGAC